jgi:DNA-binding IclR family transcriptional regulator
VLVEESLQPIMLNARVGSTLPVLTSATGRVYAAHAMDREVLSVIQEELGTLAKERANVLLGTRSLEEWLRSCREQSWIEARDEYQNGVHAFSAPVFSFRRQIAGAVTLITRSGAGDDAQHHDWGRAVSECASAMSRECGAVQQVQGDDKT